MFELFRKKIVRIRALGALLAGGIVAVSAPGAAADVRLQGGDGGGFLYSDYLQQADIFADSPAAGSFRVRIARPFLAAANDLEIPAIPLLRELRGFTPLAKSGLAVADGGHAWGKIRHTNLDLQSTLGERRANAAINILGELSESDVDSSAWQAGAVFTDDSTGGAHLGILYRRVEGTALYGVNSFVDYESQSEEFIRWSAGGEIRTPWLDIFGNYYVAVTDPRTGADGNGDPLFAVYTADGFDAEINFHSPRYPWLSAVLGYHSFDGYAENGLSREEDEGWRAGFKLAPFGMPFEAELEYERTDSDESVGGKIALHHEFGRAAGSNSGEFRAQNWNFAPAEREYVQRIYSAGDASSF